MEMLTDQQINLLLTCLLNNIISLLYYLVNNITCILLMTCLLNMYSTVDLLTEYYSTIDLLIEQHYTYILPNSHPLQP